MPDLPDAPWIRQAERDGMDDCPDVYCPICNEENPEYFFIQDGEIIGCSECTDQTDPWEWLIDHPEITDNPYGGDEPDDEDD